MQNKTDRYHDFEASVQRGEDPDMVPGVISQMAYELDTLYMHLEEEQRALYLQGPVRICRGNDAETILAAQQILQFSPTRKILYTIRSDDEYELYVWQVGGEK